MKTDEVDVYQKLVYPLVTDNTHTIFQHFVIGVPRENSDDSLHKLTESLRNNDAYETKNFKQSKNIF